MRIDATQIALIPRTNEQCLALATMVLRRFATRLGPVWLVSMLFSLLLIVPAIDRLEWTVVWAVACLIPTLFAYGTIQTGMLAAAMFGDPCSLSVGWKTLGKRNRRRLFVGVFLRSLIPLLMVGSALTPFIPVEPEENVFSFLFILFLVPICIWLLFRAMFKIEHDALSALTQNSSEHRVKSLVKDSLPNLLGRMFGLMIVSVALTYSLFLTLDFLSNLIFSFPIMSNRIPNDEYMRDLAPGDRAAYGFSLLRNDPRVIGVLSICIWCIYPVIRLAWMLSYIDLRIRRDCWDVALKIDQEAERLGVTT